MSANDKKIISHIVEKVLKDFDFEIDDILEAKKEEIEEVVQDEVLQQVESPALNWIQLVELDRAETHKNKNGDFLAN